MQLPTEDKYTYKRRYVEGQLAILMGGRVAEELTQDDITTGAGNDIERATDMARSMVCEWGMSNLGPLAYGNKEEPVFLGREFAQRSDYSDATAIRIDEEVERIIREAYEKAQDILNTHRAVLDKLAEQLLDAETMEGDEVYDLVEEMTGEDRKPKVVSRDLGDAGGDSDSGAAEASAGTDEEEATAEGDESPGEDGEPAVVLGSADDEATDLSDSGATRRSALGVPARGPQRP